MLGQSLQWQNLRAVPQHTCLQNPNVQLSCENLFHQHLSQQNFMHRPQHSSRVLCQLFNLQIWKLRFQFQDYLRQRQNQFLQNQHHLQNQLSLMAQVSQAPLEKSPTTTKVTEQCTELQSLDSVVTEEKFTNFNNSNSLQQLLKSAHLLLVRHTNCQIQNLHRQSLCCSNQHNSNNIVTTISPLVTPDCSETSQFEFVIFKEKPVFLLLSSIGIHWPLVVCVFGFLNCLFESGIKDNHLVWSWCLVVTATIVKISEEKEIFFVSISEHKASFLKLSTLLESQSFSLSQVGQTSTPNKKQKLSWNLNWQEVVYSIAPKTRKQKKLQHKQEKTLEHNKQLNHNNKEDNQEKRKWFSQQNPYDLCYSRLIVCKMLFEDHGANFSIHSFIFKNGWKLTKHKQKSQKMYGIEIDQNGWHQSKEAFVLVKKWAHWPLLCETQIATTEELVCEVCLQFKKKNTFLGGFFEPEIPDHFWPKVSHPGLRVHHSCFVFVGMISINFCWSFCSMQDTKNQDSKNVVQYLLMFSIISFFDSLKSHCSSSSFVPLLIGWSMMFTMIKTFSPECDLVLPFDFSCSKMNLNKIDWIDVLEANVFREAIYSAIHTPNYIGQQEPRKMILKSTRKHQKWTFVAKTQLLIIFVFVFEKESCKK